MTPAKIYESVTARIVSELEAGTPPWVRPWKDARHRGMSLIPANVVSGRPYSGINTLILWAQAMALGYPSHAWCTFHQAKEVGAVVRKGESSTQIVFVRHIEDEDGKGYNMMRTFNVFNLAQLEKVPQKYGVASAPKAAEIVRTEAKALADGSGVPVIHGGNVAAYYPARDCITMPALQQFDSEDDYWQTLNHELTHSTGHKSRLDRQLGKRFTKHERACEELIAELGSAFLCARLGMPAGFRSAAYLQSWIDVMKEDSRAIFTAASHASKAADWLWTQAFGITQNNDGEIPITSSPQNGEEAA